MITKIDAKDKKDIISEIRFTACYLIMVICIVNFVNVRMISDNANKLNSEKVISIEDFEIIPCPEIHKPRSPAYKNRDVCYKVNNQ